MSIEKIKKDSLELKKKLSKYDKENFMLTIADILSFLGNGPLPFKLLNELHSPLRQLFYLAALNLSSSENHRKKISDIKISSTIYNDLESIIESLNKLDNEYEKIFSSSQERPLDIEKYNIVYLSFINFYYTGGINFEEQEIERIERYFSKFNDSISREFGLTTKDIITIAHCMEELMHRNLNKPLKLIRESQECKNFFNEFVNSGYSKELLKETGIQKIDELISLLNNKHQKYILNITELCSEYEDLKVRKFIDIFSCNEKMYDDFLLMTEENPLLRYPIFKKNENEIIIFSKSQIIYAIYKLLHDYCSRSSSISEKFYKHKGEQLEIKVEEIFRKFFGEKAKIFRDYKTVLGKGQDIMVFFNGLVLIIEAKAGKKVTPALNINAAFDKIRDKFNDTIQEGCKQAIRVEDLFYNQNEVDIYDKKMNSIFTIRTKNVHHVFSIVVTLEKFSQLQTDLSILLNLPEDSRFPYSICIDDLETLLLSMKKEKFSLSDFIRFLDERELFHGRLNCSDELEICGEYFKRKKFIFPKDDNAIIRTHYSGSDIFEEFYNQGLGLNNEKNYDRKKKKNLVNLTDFYKQVY